MPLPRNSFPSSFDFKPVQFILGLIGALGIIITLVRLLFGFVSIPANSVGVRLRFGAYAGLENPGLAYAIPYIDRIGIVPTQRLLKLEFGFTTQNATNVYQGDPQPADTETMITGDLNTASRGWCNTASPIRKCISSARVNRSKRCAISRKV